MAIAAAAINNFKTYTTVVGTSTSEVYRSPIGFSAVFLLTQCTNIGSSTQVVNFYFNKNVSGIGTVVTEIVKNYPIPSGDSSKLVDGKLVLEPDDYVTISGSTDTDLKLVLSVLETSI